MTDAVPLQVLQGVVLMVGSPLYAGSMARAEAIVASKRGPSVWQPYRDLAKLLRKGAAISDGRSSRRADPARCTTESGDVNLYLLYVFVAVFIAYLVASV